MYSMKNSFLSHRQFINYKINSDLFKIKKMIFRLGTGPLFSKSNNKKQPGFRWYLLRTTNKLCKERSLLLFGGLSQKEKTFSSIEEEGKKAFRAGYNKILLSWNFVFHPEKQKILKWISKKPESFVLAVHKKSFVSFKQLFEQKRKRLLLDLNLEDYEGQLLDELESRNWTFQITIPAHKGVDLKRLSYKLLNRYKRDNDKSDCSKIPPADKTDGKSKTIKKIYIHFPCNHKKHSQLYSSEEIYSFLKKDCWLPPPPIDIYNLSIPEDLVLEPDKEPEFSYHIPGSRPLASVIIPSYNCSEELIISLKHLYQQDLKRQKWEVLVVDDGSDDGTTQALKNLGFLTQINFKLIYLPRKQKRTNFADHRFRAGIARNLGVKQARGKFLLFLDSDILTPPHYLSSICQQLKTENVIQHPRYHLLKSAPKEYSQIDKTRHIFVREPAYWENFYSTAQDWNEKRLPWKYVSTNTLCLKSSVFKQVGRFRKNYTCYGFEDTDLGWRLYEAGFRFKLNPVITYHLFRPSEFSGSDDLKRRLLGLSAKTFFHNSHCLEAYEEFRHLIQNT